MTPTHPKCGHVLWTPGDDRCGDYGCKHAHPQSWKKLSPRSDIRPPESKARALKRAFKGIR